MAATGRDGGRGPSWSYRHEQTGSSSPYSTSSSRSGTIVSTAYASSASRPSTVSVEETMHFLSLGIHGDWEEAEEEEVGEEEAEHRREILVKEFFSGRFNPSNEMYEQRWLSELGVCSNIKRERGDMSVMERWLTKLGVGWVLSFHDGAAASAAAAAGEELDCDARTWIRALRQIVQTVCFRTPLFPGHVRGNLPSICEERGKHVHCKPDRYHVALIIQEIMSKILTFVDVVVVAWDPNTTEELLSLDRVMMPPYSKLISLLGVHDALSAASCKILTQFNGPTSVKVTRIQKEMAILLSAYKNKLGEVIWSTMEKIRTKSMEDGDDLSSPQGSSDIHKVTRSITRYIRFLWSNYKSVDAAIPGKYVAHTKNIRPLDQIIIEMVSCVQEKLANISESFSDQGLRFLFLLNNLDHIEQHIADIDVVTLQRHTVIALDLTYQIKGHMERYVEVSWPLLLSCLFNPTPLRLWKNYSPLSKFESEFQKIYTTQKQWKVPDPRLRRRLREAITDKIIPGYTKYLEDNKVTTPKFTPQELKEMLQELFEG